MKRTYLTTPVKEPRRLDFKRGQQYLMQARGMSRAEVKLVAPLSRGLSRWLLAHRNPWPFGEDFDYADAMLCAVSEDDVQRGLMDAISEAFAALGDPTWTERDEQELLRYNAGPL
jgi:hypothetical protein